MKHSRSDTCLRIPLFPNQYVLYTYRQNFRSALRLKKKKNSVESGCQRGPLPSLFSSFFCWAAWRLPTNGRCLSFDSVNDFTPHTRTPQIFQVYQRHIRRTNSQTRKKYKDISNKFPPKTTATLNYSKWDTRLPPQWAFSRPHASPRPFSSRTFRTASATTTRR